nr:MAG TPA: hypothetical protein [Caudoviricetes sp.]
MCVKYLTTCKLYYIICKKVRCRTHVMMRRKNIWKLYQEK